MKTAVCVSVFLVGLFQLSSAVTVKEGDFEFSLESVKVLGALITENELAVDQNAMQLEARAAAVCVDPALPEDFKPLCLRQNAGASLARLAFVAAYPDACELCESVACYGC